MKIQFIFRRRLKIALVVMSILAVRLGCGEVEAFRTCGESLSAYFVKKKWSWQFTFEHPYAADQPDRVLAEHTDADGRWLPHTEEARAFAAYCRARYGLETAQDHAAEDHCRSLRIGD